MSRHMRTTVHLPDELLVRAKRKAAAEGRTLTSLIEEGLRAVVADRPGKGSPAKKVRLPVSKATGGLLPGIDPIKINTGTEESEDIERLRRITRR